MIKNKILWLAIFSIVGLGLGHVLPRTPITSFCPWDSVYYAHSCGYIWFKLGDALFYGMGALALIFFLLYLVPRAFNTWKMFAIWFVPLAALLFIFTPEPQGFDLFTPEPQKVFQWVSGFYIVVSGLIIFGNLLLSAIRKR